MDHDVGLEVLHADEVSPVGDHQEGEGGKVDADDVVSKPPLEDDVEMGLTCLGLVLHLDHLNDDDDDDDGIMIDLTSN